MWSWASRPFWHLSSHCYDLVISLICGHHHHHITPSQSPPSVLPILMIMILFQHQHWHRTSERGSCRLKAVAIAITVLCCSQLSLVHCLLSHQHRGRVGWQWKRWGGCLVVSGPLASTSQLGAAVTTLWLYNNSILIVMAATISSHKHSSHLNGAMPDISRHATLNFLFTEGRFTVRWK